MYGVLSQIESQLSLKHAWLPPFFFLDTKSAYQDLLSPDSFKPRKNIPVLVSIDVGNQSIWRCTEHMRNNNSRHRL